jgi:hypothetical protein
MLLSSGLNLLSSAPEASVALLTLGVCGVGADTLADTVVVQVVAASSSLVT